MCFGIENDVEMHLEFHIDLDSDSVSFEACLGSLLVQFSEPLGGLGGSLGRRRESEEGAKRGLGAKVAPSRLWDIIWGLWGSSWDAFWEVLGGSLAAKWEPKGFNKVAKGDISDEIAPSSM